MVVQCHKFAQGVFFSRVLWYNVSVSKLKNCWEEEHMKKLELVLNILSAILCIATIILMVKNRIESRE